MGAQRHPSTVWLRVSHSKLDDYRACPLRGHLNWGVPKPQVQQPETVFGSAMHYMFRLFMKPHPRTKRYPYGELELFKNVWKGFWWRAVKGKHGFESRTAPPAKVAWEDDAHPGRLFGAGLNVLEEFFNQHLKLRTERPHLLERRFSVSFGDIILSGIIDRIDLEPDGATVIDYKPRYDRLSLDLGSQLTFYQIGYNQLRKRIKGRPPLKRLRIYQYWTGEWLEAPLRSESDIGMIFRSSAELSWYLRGIYGDQQLDERILAQIHQFNVGHLVVGDLPPKLPRGKHCQYCPHLHHGCAAWVAGQPPPARQQFQEYWDQNRAATMPTQLPLLQHSVVAAAVNAYRTSLLDPEHIQIDLFPESTPSA
ncbi:MAG: PD-(D/E)XK nuclease family protein [Candidatus Kerfeldbacteria bacterium]|nr:PD-(D/E)XK nuclease family protein [Candidatus Kerfeldbacteria bacterium]